MEISVNGERLDTTQDKIVLKYDEKLRCNFVIQRPTIVYKNKNCVYFLVKNNGNFCKVLSEDEFLELRKTKL